MLKRTIAFVVAAVMALSMSACSQGSGADSSSAAGGKTRITILGTIKDEVSDSFNEAMKAYNESQDKYELSSVPLDGTAYEKMTTLYAGGNAPTIMVMGQEASTFKDKLLDVSGQDLVKQARDGTTELMTDGSKIYGLPITVEAFGILYNQEVLDKAVGGAFDPASINSRSALKALLQKIAATGVSPDRVCALDWSLGAHLTNLMYATQSDDLAKDRAFMTDLENGKVNLTDNKVFNGWLDTLDLLLENNASKKSPLTPTYDDDLLAIAKGQTGVYFQGNWTTPMISQANPSAKIGIMPYPISDNPSDYGNTQISVGASLYFTIDASQSTKEQQEGALDFINWFFTSKQGQEFCVDKMKFIPPYKNITKAPSDNLSKMVLQYMNDNKTLNWLNMYYPGDASSAFGSTLQKYICAKTDRAGVAKDFQNYWAGKKSA